MNSGFEISVKQISIDWSILKVDHDYVEHRHQVTIPIQFEKRMMKKKIFHGIVTLVISHRDTHLNWPDIFVDLTLPLISPAPSVKFWLTQVTEQATQRLLPDLIDSLIKPSNREEPNYWNCRPTNVQIIIVRLAHTHTHVKGFHLCGCCVCIHFQLHWNVIFMEAKLVNCSAAVLGE